MLLRVFVVVVIVVVCRSCFVYFWFGFVLVETVSLFSPDCHRTSYVDQAGLEFIDI